MTTVVSGFHPAAYDVYGKRFLETFDRYWPKDVNLFCYIETESVPAGRANLVHLWCCDGMQEFLARHSTIPEHCGRAPVATWKPKEHAAGYSFRYDAVKFSRQSFVPDHAASMYMRDGEILVWLDADVISFADAPQGMVEGLLGDADVCYLGRGAKHTELGFWAVRLSSATRGFLEEFRDMYRSDAVFDLPQWHSAYVWDVCRRRFEAAGGRTHDLTPGGRGHVFTQHPIISKCLDHLKGNRKMIGRSPERRT